MTFLLKSDLEKAPKARHLGHTGLGTKTTISDKFLKIGIAGRIFQQTEPIFIGSGSLHFREAKSNHGFARKGQKFIKKMKMGTKQKSKKNTKRITSLRKQPQLRIRIIVLIV